MKQLQKRRLLSASVWAVPVMAIIAGCTGGAGGNFPQVPGATLVALTTGNNLIRFNSSTTGTVTNTFAISGLQAGESILGIDIRPSNGQLYAVGSTGRLYTLNTATGAASLVGTLAADPTDTTAPFTALSGTEFGVDFNPVPDRLRVVSNTDQNLRINPDTARVITDGTLAYDTDTDGVGPDTGDANAGANPNVVASAYTNSVAGAQSTTLYNLDSNLNILALQNPPNNGTLNTVGALGVDITEQVAFDIPGTSTTGFVALASPGDTASRLYSINLTTGAATSLGTIGGGAVVRGLTVVP